MIKEALEYIVKMNDTTEWEQINRRVYCNKEMKLVGEYNCIKPIQLHTLTSLVDYIKSDEENIPEKLYIIVNDYNSIKVISHLDEDKERECIINVDSLTPQFRFGEWYTQEQFTIALQSQFVDAADKELLLKVIGTVQAGTVAEYGDDGTTQKATIKSGVTTKSEVLVPNPVTLVPYRSFLEIGHPETRFIFRLKQDDRSGEVKAALFEADGGAWKLSLIEYIKKYLEDELVDYTNIQILA